MARDARLAGHGSSYFSENEPQRYIDFTKDVFEKKKNLNYADLFTVPADSFETPFSPGRFNETDIRKSLSARKQKLNPGLGFVRPYWSRVESVCLVGGAVYSILAMPPITSGPGKVKAQNFQ